MINKEYKEYEEEVEVEGKSNVVLVFGKKLKEKIDYLSTDYTKSEIGGFLTYKEIVKDEDGDVTIILDDLLIPPQEATAGEDEIFGVGQIEMRKEYGDKCLKIIGHWHSHHTLGSFFSSEDEVMMKSYSENKPFRIFVVSSEGKHLIRLVLKSSFEDMPIELKVENIEYRVEIDDSIKKEMEEEIKKKVKEPVVTTRTYLTKSNRNSNNGMKKLKKEISMRIKYLQHQNHKVRVEKVFRTYADSIEEEFKILNPTIEKLDEQHFSVVVELGDKNKAKEFMSDVKAFLLKQLMIEREKAEEVQSSGEEVDNQLEEYLSELDEEEMEEYERNNAGYGSRRCDWSHYRDKEIESPQEKLQKDFYSGHSHMDYSY